MKSLFAACCSIREVKSSDVEHPIDQPAISLFELWPALLSSADVNDVSSQLLWAKTFQDLTQFLEMMIEISMEELTHVPKTENHISSTRVNMALSTILNLPQLCFDRKSRDTLTEAIIQNLIEDDTSTSKLKSITLELSVLVRFAPSFRTSSRLVRQFLSSSFYFMSDVLTDKRADEPAEACKSRGSPYHL